MLARYFELSRLGTTPAGEIRGGLTTALGISAAMPLAGFVAALFLPDPENGEVG